MTDETTTTATRLALCALCKMHRRCTSCDLGYVEGDTCTECDAELGPAPLPRAMPPLFEGAKPLTELLHERCGILFQARQVYKVIIEGYLHGVGLGPLDAAFDDVVKRGFVGWLEVRRAFERAHAFREETTVRLVRLHAEPTKKGWLRAPVSPGIVADIRGCMADGAVPVEMSGPDLDVDVSGQTEPVS